MSEGRRRAVGLALDIAIAAGILVLLVVCVRLLMMSYMVSR